ncbi:hypothetical protein SD71_04550 [Cohnella kolymensis]|uniref:CRISPR-associated protein Cas5 n=2 Tax=Cohnella kolymensis TaxID=1590652 RepID=A0ABR5A7D7_9BACL|nr:hypothetical protein SD71_04550 [Cohnella kolymensis]
MDPRQLENLQITFHVMSEMIVPEYPIPLETLLIYSNYSADAQAERTETPADLPVARHPSAPELYMASIGFIHSAGRHMQFFTKNIAAKKQLWKAPSARVDLTGGFFKAYHTRLFTLIPPVTVTFYAYGKRDAIDELVHRIPALGSKRGHGFGKVSSVHITQIDDNLSWIHQDRPMRAIPVRLYPDRIKDWYYTVWNLIPPSYSAQGRELCYVPRQDEWLSVVNNRGPSVWETDTLPVAKPLKSKRGKSRHLWQEE